jgi:hypothetical protein
MDNFEDFLNSEEMKQYKDSHLDFEKLFSIQELEIIFNSIDKTDYSHMGIGRWFDLHVILDQIYKNKLLHTNVILSKMIHNVIHETWPPHNKYYYHYIVDNLKI